MVATYPSSHHVGIAMAMIMIIVVFSGVAISKDTCRADQPYLLCGGIMGAKVIGEMTSTCI